MNVNRVCYKIANHINKSPKTQKVLRAISDSPAVFSTISACVIGFTLRPATTLAITKDRQDGIYGACSSISSALVELIGGIAILKPMQKAICKSSQQLYNTEGSIFYHNPEILRRYKSINNRAYKMPTLIVTSLLKFGLVHPISVLLNKIGIVKSVRGKVDANG